MLGAVTVFCLMATVSVAFAENEDKVGVCHETSSEKNPIVIINVSEKAALKHAEKHGDAILVPNEVGCPTIIPPQE